MGLRPHSFFALSLILWAGALAGQPALADSIEPFVGTYVGTAQVLGPDGQVTEMRDMDITIDEERGGGFKIVWINVSLIDGRRDVPGVRRRVDEVTMEPGDLDGVYLEKARRSLFERRRETNVVEGDPMRWARIDNGRLGVFSLVVLDDGSYELQSYERILTETGLDIEFRRVDDGVVTRSIIGRTVRVE